MRIKIPKVTSPAERKGELLSATISWPVPGTETSSAGFGLLVPQLRGRSQPFQASSYRKYKVLLKISEGHMGLNKVVQMYMKVQAVRLRELEAL